MSTPFPDPIIKPFSNTGDNATPPLGPISTAANQETGFPILESTPLDAGGIPVTREEFNGAFNFYTKQILALVSGCRFTFNQDLSDEQNGYPLGAVLYCASNNSLQMSLVNNNTFNFITTPSYIDDGVHWSAITVDDVYAKNFILRNQGELVFYDSTHSHFVSLVAATSLSSDTNYRLPIAYPTTNGQILSCSTSGVMDWIKNLQRVTYTQGSNITVTVGNPLLFDTLYDSNYAGSSPFVSGIFTAPITSTYRFDMNLLATATSSPSLLDIKIDTSSPVITTTVFYIKMPSITDAQISPSFYLKLNVGQTAKFTSSTDLDYGPATLSISQLSISW